MNSKNVKSFNINKNAQINKINILQFVKILENIKEKYLIKSCLYFYLKLSYLYGNENENNFDSFVNSDLTQEEDINVLNAVYRLNLNKNLIFHLIYIFQITKIKYYNFLFFKLKNLRKIITIFERIINFKNLNNISLFLKKKKFIKILSINNSFQKIKLKKLINFKLEKNLNYQMKKYLFKKIQFKHYPNIFSKRLILLLFKHYSLLKTFKRRFLSKILQLEYNSLIKVERNELIKLLLLKNNLKNIKINNLKKYVYLWKRNTRNFTNIYYLISYNYNRLFISKILFFWEILKKKIFIYKRIFYNRMFKKSMYYFNLKIKNIILKELIFKKITKQKIINSFKESFYLWKNNNILNSNKFRPKKNEIILTKNNHQIYNLKLSILIIDRFMIKKKNKYFSFFFQVFLDKYLNEINQKKKLSQLINIIIKVKQIILKYHFRTFIFYLFKKNPKPKNLDLSHHYYLYRSIYIYYIFSKYRNFNTYKYSMNYIWKKWYFKTTKSKFNLNNIKKEKEILKLKINDYIESSENLNKHLFSIKKNIQKCMKDKFKNYQKNSFEKNTYENRNTENELNMSITNDEFNRINFIPNFEVRHKDIINENIESLNEEEMNLLDLSKNHNIITGIDDNYKTVSNNDSYIEYLFNYEEEIKKNFLELQSKYEFIIEEIQNEINNLLYEIDELSM